MSNSWAKLVRLLPSVESTVGKILSISGKTAVVESIGTGTSTVLTMEPGMIAQTGNVTYNVGDWVLIKDNIIVSVLPVPELVSGGATEIIIA